MAAEYDANGQNSCAVLMRSAIKRMTDYKGKQLSLDLQAAFPESKGFSASNLWRMKQWYSTAMKPGNSHKLRENYKHMIIKM